MSTSPNHDRLLFLRMHLERAARGEDVGLNVSEALYRADRWGSNVLSAVEANDLRGLAIAAADQACAAFPDWAPRSHVRLGFRAFLEWLDFAQLDPEERRQVGSLDHRERVRILRNIAHNVSLEISIAEREAGQTARLIEEPRRRAGQ